MRPLFIAGNWKMNPVSLESAMALGEAVVGGVGQEAHVRVAICPPFLYLKGLDETLSNTPVGLGAQNMSDKESGAYTGEVSGPMLQDLGCTHVILGHSERRHGMGETDAQVNAKLHAALKVKLLPIVCIGELLEEREAGKTEEVVRTQLEGSLAEITPEQMGEVVLAYEPVWAIGTGKVATPRQAQEVHAFIRAWLAGQFGEAVAQRVIIQYGGSVKPDNAGELLGCPDIDGALVGGASLSSEQFLGIIEAARGVMRQGKA